MNDDSWEMLVKYCGGCKWFVDGECRKYGYPEYSLKQLVRRYAVFAETKRGKGKVFCEGFTELNQDSF